jgi:anthranilate synthase component 2
MGFRHESLPIHGVQFHPESIATEHGHALLANFMEIAGMKAKEPA